MGGLPVAPTNQKSIYVAGGISNYSGNNVAIDQKYYVTVAFDGADSITEAVSGFVVKCDGSNGTFVWSAKINRDVLQVNGSNSKATRISGSSITRDYDIKRCRYPSERQKMANRCTIMPKRKVIRKLWVC